MSDPRNKPDYKIHALNKVTRGRAAIGAAWTNEPEKTISLRFDEFIDLNTLRGPDVIITLFPEDPELKKKRFSKPKP